MLSMIPYPVEVDVLVKQHRLRTVAAGAAFVALAGLTSACSGGSSSTSATSPVTATLPASALKSAAPANTQITGSLANGTSWIAEYPRSWNGTLILYSHGYGSLTAADAPDPGTQTALLDQGYALAGSSYDPSGSEWARGMHEHGASLEDVYRAAVAETARTYGASAAS